jgi:hypothetical protein
MGAFMKYAFSDGRSVGDFFDHSAANLEYICTLDRFVIEDGILESIGDDAFKRRSAISVSALANHSSNGKTTGRTRRYSLALCVRDPRHASIR